MRVSALIQLSALTACPLALLTLNSSGDSRVPSPPTPNPQKPETASSSKHQTATAVLPTLAVPPEAFAAEASGIGQPAAPNRILVAQPQQAPANLPVPPIYSLQSITAAKQISPSGLQTARQPLRNSSPARSIALPEQINFSWDRLVARSVGLDENTFATVSRAATSAAVSPATSPQELLPEAAALDSQPENDAPGGQILEPSIAQAVAPSTASSAPSSIASSVTSSIASSIPSSVMPSETQPEMQPEMQPGTQPEIPLAAELAAQPAIQTSSQTAVSAGESAPPNLQSDRPTNLTPAAPGSPAVAEAVQTPTQPSQQPTTLAQLPASQPVPNSLPAPLEESYRLGPGDTIQVNLFNVPEYSSPQRVLVDGTVNLPVVGAVSVSGLTLAEAEQKIGSAYGRELRNIRVTVSLAQSRPLRVGVAGEVRQPGYYVLAGDAQLPTIAQAIQTAGGVTQLADLRQVQVRRARPNGTPEIFTVNLWALLEQGDLSQNLALRDGDTIVLTPTASLNAAEADQLAASNLASNQPQAISISLVGEVGRPGAYKLDTAAGNRATLTQAIQAAGGVTSGADLRKIEVQRTARNGTIQTTTLDLWQLVTAGDLSQDLILQSGDRILIAKAPEMTPEEMRRLTSSSVSPENIRINIVGEAQRAGTLQLPANTTLNEALLAAGGFNRRARSTVQLVRINPNGTLTERRIEVDWERPVDPETNPILSNNDVIIVRRNGLASISDTATTILEPVFRILPIFGLF